MQALLLVTKRPYAAFLRQYVGLLQSRSISFVHKAVCIEPSLKYLACLPANSQGSSSRLYRSLSSGVADTELYDKVDYSKPETVGLSLFNQVWGQSPEKGAVSLTKTMSDPSMTGRGFACESSLVGFPCRHVRLLAPCSTHLPVSTY